MHADQETNFRATKDSFIPVVREVLIFAEAFLEVQEEASQGKESMELCRWAKRGSQLHLKQQKYEQELQS